MLKKCKKNNMISSLKELDLGRISPQLFGKNINETNKIESSSIKKNNSFSISPREDLFVSLSDQMLKKSNSFCISPCPPDEKACGEKRLTPSALLPKFNFDNMLDSSNSMKKVNSDKDLLAQLFLSEFLNREMDNNHS